MPFASCSVSTTEAASRAQQAILCSDPSHLRDTPWHPDSIHTRAYLQRQLARGQHHERGGALGGGGGGVAGLLRAMGERRQ